MFTGVIDKDGEETVNELGGEMIDSVYQCTHLVTDKVYIHLYMLNLFQTSSNPVSNLLSNQF